LYTLEIDDRKNIHIRISALPKTPAVCMGCNINNNVAISLGNDEVPNICLVK